MMIYPHRIRLRGPWECTILEPVDSTTAPAEPRRVAVPGRLSDMGLAVFAGRVKLTRKFGYPGRIDGTERVWLTFAGIEGAADILLNGQTLARKQAGPAEFEVTRQLQQHNTLEVQLDAASDEAGLWGEVALEIRCTAYLCDVRLHADAGGTMHVQGAVAGFCVEPLEIYVLVDGRNAAYRLVRPGDSFSLPLDPPGKIVRVELVNVAVLWYFVELSAA